MGKTFKLGKTIIHRNAVGVLNHRDVSYALKRHQNCDWGVDDLLDKEANDAAVRYKGRILSSYRDSGGTKFFLITDANRKTTRILLADDF